MAIQTIQVFGVSSQQVLSYIERPSVDDRFVSALQSDKQIVVYGSSKQGKTALVTKHLPYEDNIVVSLTPKSQVTDIYASVLRQLGIKIKQTTKQASGKSTGVSSGVSFKALVPLLGGVKADGKVDAGSSKGVERTYDEVPFNLELPQDISELVSSIQQDTTVILENFHYLDDDKQQQLAYDLRTYQELGIQFVILGVWREKNRLSQFNGDLLDRITEVPVEPWSKQEFFEVATKGCQQLNIHMSETVVSECADASFSSIGVFQELLKEVCLSADVQDDENRGRSIEDPQLVASAVRTKAEQYASRHQRALESIASGNVSASAKGEMQPLFLPYYLVKAVLDAGYDGLENGMRRASIHESIQALHHRGADVRASDMSNLLYNLAKLQSNKHITPPIIDYDRTSSMLQIVDSTFYFFLKHADLDLLSEQIPSPLG